MSVAQLSNPFSTRFTKPGAIKFLFTALPSFDLPTLIDRLRDQDWTGEIVGPHGSGKTTLLHELLDAIQAAGKRLKLCSCQAGRPLPDLRRIEGAVDEDVVVTVDGHEQFGWWARRRLRKHCRAAGVGLLTTSHRATGLPILVETRGSRQLAHDIVARLPIHLASSIEADDIDRCYRRCRGNLREMLFSLYDIYEQRARR